jgi:UDP-N-acetylmuramate--alanine ligase
VGRVPHHRRLAQRGAKIMIGHKAENIEGVGALVISTAIKGGNPEVDAARARAIPVVRRADMLAELIRLKWTVAIAGTHGKTTTTSMVAALLDGVGLDPTVINGGVINAYASNAKLGNIKSTPTNWSGRVDQLGRPLPGFVYGGH